MIQKLFIHIIVFHVILFTTGLEGFTMTRNFPETPKIAVRDTLHGTVILDNYQWLEKADDPQVKEWTAAQMTFTQSYLDTVSQRAYLAQRFNELWRYDDETVPRRVPDSGRLFFWVKKTSNEKWAYAMKDNDQAETRIILDPNTWPENDQVHGAVPSRDGKYLAYGKAVGGNESPVVHIMEIDTGRILPDSLQGWKQYVSAWLPDNSGFYYNAKPLKGTVPEGEEFYWHTAYFHKLGTSADQDQKVFGHDTNKSYWHSVDVSEDGRYEIYYRSLFNKNEVYFRKTGSDAPLTPIATGFDAEYGVQIIEDQIYIYTDRDAPRKQVFATAVDQPEVAHWQPFIPEHERDILEELAAIGGRFYAVYQHNAYTKIQILDRAGTIIRELPLPTLGSADITGEWSRDEVWVIFSSFTYPKTTYRYDFEANELAIYREFPLDIDVSAYTAEQVWYPSRDGTEVSMFLVQRKDAKHDGQNPVLLTGYGGFGSSQNPYFSTTALVWLECGGMMAIPNLRGGGEYGKTWHEAGMLDRKQNVFDDFIAAGEWLIENGYTNPEKLAISGGSNGGLLVGAVTTQRPDLFRAVLCAVPLLDMVRYHKFGFANVWAEEYGSAEDPEQFAYIYQYSPYHRVVEGTAYPAMLITGSENDVRVDPLHARKMVARLQEATANGHPIFLMIEYDSGHTGGTTISTQIGQYADMYGFLMNQLGMHTPGMN